ncbi:presequence protease-like protein [Ramicandelaber brevisporus]|nr:presequence protease-like protein [Ramicandelaber brevisporus]
MLNAFKRHQLVSRTASSVQARCLALPKRGLATAVPGFDAANLKPSQQVHGFRVAEVRPVDELSLLAVRLQHESTGAEYLHIARDDPNNVFSVGFNTQPTDSTGIAHILEHTTLCGSARYPVRDPFFKMLTRSMATFMNAWTAHDYTQYPFSTLNRADYANLRNVYMDATFKPLLRPLDFAQEGWRLERRDPKDASAPFEIKGVVYNEMKGAFSDAGSLFYSKANRFMFSPPANSKNMVSEDGSSSVSTYAHESGGDPVSIPDLTYEQLKNFHASNYHPSNARFFSYGNFELLPQLQYVDEYISQLDKMSVKFLTNDLRDVDESFAMSVFASLLLDGPSSPMHKALIDSGLGSEYSADTGYCGWQRHTTLSVGLQGINAEQDGARIEQAIADVLAAVKRDGFPAARVEGVLHGIELANKHKSASFGISLMSSISHRGWFHGVNPIDLLKVNDTVASFRAKLNQSDPNSNNAEYFGSIVDKYFTNSSHKLVFAMKPSSEYLDKSALDEGVLLEKKVAALTDADKEKLTKQGLELLAKQDVKEDLSCLPTLTLADIAREGSYKPRSHTTLPITGHAVQKYSVPTNGISYMSLINPVNIASVPTDLVPYIPLFMDAITYLGTHSRDMAEIETDIRLHTGGIRAAYVHTHHHSDINRREFGVSVGSHCLERNIDRMYGLMEELVSQTNYENVDRLRTLLSATAANEWSSIAQSGHSYALMLASATLDKGAALNERLGGLEHIRFIKQLAIDCASNDAALKDTAGKLKQLAQILLKPAETARVALTMPGEFETANIAGVERLISAMNTINPAGQTAASSADAAHAHALAPGSRLFCALPFASNYTAKCFKTVPYTHPDSASLQVLSSLMTSLYLHREVREKNGAYGGSARNAALDGLFSMTSYRDPNPLITSQTTFDRAAEWAASSSTEFSDREITEAKLTIFGALDKPVSISSEGMTLFTTGITDEMRQKRREQLLDVTAKDCRIVAEKYLVNGAQNASVAVLGEESHLKDNGHKWSRVDL